MADIRFFKALFWDTLKGVLLVWHHVLEQQRLRKASSSCTHTHTHSVHIFFSMPLTISCIGQSFFCQSVQLHCKVSLSSPSESIWAKYVKPIPLESRFSGFDKFLVTPAKWHLDLQKKTCYEMAPLLKRLQENNTMLLWIFSDIHLLPLNAHKVWSHFDWTLVFIYIGRKKSNTTCKYNFDTRYLSKRT